MLLLRNAACEEAFRVGEKIRHVLEEKVFETVGQVTCSIGITEVRGDDTLEEAIGRADRALYAAKEGGRNRTVACEVRQ